ncbi:MAG: hypothetical protein MUF87_18340 [Anaerolineae bacterium]|nr:hypothetical protein [Anaerolineae bacterium]
MTLCFYLVWLFRVGFLTSERNLTIPLTTLPLSPNFFSFFAAVTAACDRPVIFEAEFAIDKPAPVP